MKALTINLPDDVEEKLRALSTREQRSLEETASDIIRRRLRLDRFHELCRESEAYARAAGYTSEEDVLRDIS